MKGSVLGSWYFNLFLGNVFQLRPRLPVKGSYNCDIFGFQPYSTGASNSSRFNLTNFLPGFRCKRIAAWDTRVHCPITGSRLPRAMALVSLKPGEGGWQTAPAFSIRKGRAIMISI